MILRRLPFNRYTDRFVYRHLPPALHASYKLLRHGTYDAERLRMYNRAALWLLVNKVNGSICEFGTAGGESFLNLYFQFSKMFSPCPVFYIFDSFEGLPDSDERTAHQGWKKGDFAFPYEAFLHRMDFFGIPRSQYQVTKGFFKDSLSRENWVRLNMGRLALVHIDCDLYDSTVLSLQFIQENLQPGTVLLFDDYYCSKGNLRMGESGAFQEWLSKHPEWKAVPWYDYSVHGKAFILAEGTAS